ncbi:MAG: hypothetical protein HY000_09965 [Planctomycetes bacterium]|nr:hypothetical protein [Planctomycetota bacterium]
MDRSWWVTGLTGLCVVALLPWVGRWARPDRDRRCALDGGGIQPTFRVRVVLDRRQSHEFCSLRCAELWLEARQRPPHAVFVTDEVTTREIPASAAHYVRSSVVTNPVTRERRHVFASPSDALRHVRAFGGRLLVGEERPFHTEG